MPNPGSVFQTPPQIQGPQVPPELQDQMAEQEQSTWSAPVRGLANAIGGIGDFVKGYVSGDPTDPTASRANLLGQLASNASGVGEAVTLFPSVAERLAGTQAFRDEAAKLPQAFQDAGNWLADKYPRIAAHISMRPGAYDLGPSGMAQMTVKDTREIPFAMRFSDQGLQTGAADPNQARGMVAHEATHAAQALGNKDWPTLYNASQAAVGYRNNPFEQTARARQAAAEAGQPHVTNPQNAIRGLQTILAGGTPSSNEQAVSAIRNTMFNRNLNAQARGLPALQVVDPWEGQ